MAQTDYKTIDPAGYDLYAVDSTQKYPYGTRCRAISQTLGEGEFVYLKGAANTAEGVAVTFDEEGVTTLLAANAKGPVAWALAATVANTFGWYQRLGKIAADCAAASLADAGVGREGADGQIGDGRAAGDEIYGVLSRSATDTPATGFCWVQAFAYPWVDDANGA